MVNIKALRMCRVPLWLYRKLLLSLYFSLSLIAINTTQSSAQSKQQDPFLTQLLNDCSSANWRGIKSLMMLQKAYPNTDLSRCYKQIKKHTKETQRNRVYPQSALASSQAVHHWLLFKHALEQQNLKHSLSLKKYLQPLTKPRIVDLDSSSSTEPIKIDHASDLGMYCSAMFAEPKRHALEWTLAPSTQAQTLSMSYRGLITVQIGKQKHSLTPSNHLWIDDHFFTIDAHQDPVNLRVNLEQNSCFLLRLGKRVYSLTLWERLKHTLDQKPASVTEDALLTLAFIAEIAQIDEADRILPIIETDQRWSKEANLWLSQAFQALSPPEIKAQAWGDYPPKKALETELKKTKKSFIPTKLTHYYILLLDEFYEHLINGRIYKARKLLDLIESQISLQTLSWLKQRIIFAKNTLDRHLGLSVSALYRLKPLGIRQLFTQLPGELEQSALALEYIQALGSVSQSEKTAFLSSDLFHSWLSSILKSKTNLAPALIQIISEYLLFTSPKDPLWLQGLQAINQGPMGLVLADQLRTLFLAEAQFQKQHLLEQEMSHRFPYFSSKKNKVALNPSQINHSSLLGKQEPWSTPTKESELGLKLKQDSVQLETIYHHAHYDLDQGRLRKIERRILKPLTAHAAQTLIKMSLAHSPSRQSFSLDHIKHLRGSVSSKDNLFQDITKAQRSQRSLSNPEARLYYDLIAEDIQFADLRAGDIIDIQWSITELNSDPSFSLPHADLFSLQDRSFKRCMLVTMSSDLEKKFHAEIDLKALKDRLQVKRFEQSCDMSDETNYKKVASLSQMPPLVQEEGSLQGTSIFPYIHLSNLKSWSTIATLYKAMLEPMLKPTDLLIHTAQTWTKKIKPWDQSLEDRQRYEKEIIEQLFLQITKNTRYVGLEFGRHSYEPARPDITLTRGLGDCKDRATLMIALAKTLGIQLDFAMIRTRSAGKMNTKGLASLSSFDHAAVYSPSLKRYFDPTLAHYDPSVLPQADHGAQSLLIDTKATLDNFPPRAAELHLQTIPPTAIDSVGEIIRLISQTQNVDQTELIQFEIFGQKAAQIRERLTKHSQTQSQLSTILQKTFPDLSIDFSQVGVGKVHMQDRDPIVITLNALSTENKKKRLGHGQLAFNLSQSLFFTTSQRTQSLVVPQTRRIRCIKRKQANKVREKNTLDNINQFRRAPLRGWFIKANQTIDEVCLKVYIESSEVLPSDYKKAYHWLHDAEQVLNNELKLLINTYY